MAIKRTNVEIRLEPGEGPKDLERKISAKIRALPTDLFENSDPHEIALMVTKEGPQKLKPPKGPHG